jgi:hypothetical protein
MHPNLRLPAPGENLPVMKPPPDKVWRHLLDVPDVRQIGERAVTCPLNAQLPSRPHRHRRRPFDSSVPRGRSCHHRFQPFADPPCWPWSEARA